MAVKRSKHSHQSSSTSENAVKVIETTVTASGCVLPEWFGCQVDSESIAPSCGLSGARHICPVSPRSVVMITTCVFG